MEFPVELRVGGVAIGGRLVHANQLRSKQAQRGAGQVVHGVSNRGAFEHGADDRNLEDLVGREDRHGGADVRSRLEQAFADQAHNGLADGNLADSQFGGNLVEDDSASRLVPPGEDRAAKRFVDQIRLGAVGRQCLVL